MTQPVLDAKGLIGLIWQSVVAPQSAAKVLIGLNVSRAVLWQALLLVTVLSVLLVAITQAPMPELPINGTGPVLLTPFTYAMILGASLTLLVVALFYTGRTLGGKGSFTGALTVVIWLEVLGMAIRVAQVGLAVFGQWLGQTFSAIGLVILFWALINFITVLHGFRSNWMAFLTLVLAVFGISLGLSMILAFIGVGVTGGSF